MAHAALRLRPQWQLRFAHDAACAHGALAGGEIDLTIVDAGLPDADGLSLPQAIAARHPHLSQILISGHNDAAARARARTCGARGFIAKTMASAAIFEPVEAVLRGEILLEPVREADDGAPKLSPRQAEILELLSEGHGNKEIRHRLGIAERTVRSHLTDLFQRLDAQSRTQALIRARELGLIG